MKMKSFKVLFVFLLLWGAQPQPAIEVNDVQGKIKGLYTSFTANFSYSSSSGELYSGKIYYQYPDKLHIQLSDGRVIATNGKFLWTYNASTRICARQSVKPENGGGLFYFLQAGYSVHEENGRYIFKGKGDNLPEVSLKVDDGNLKSVQFKSKRRVAPKNTKAANEFDDADVAGFGDDVINVSFSNMVTDTSMKASLFNYKPDPEAQLVENPLNRIGIGMN